MLSRATDMMQVCGISPTMQLKSWMTRHHSCCIAVQTPLKLQAILQMQKHKYYFEHGNFKLSKFSSSTQCIFCCDDYVTEGNACCHEQQTWCSSGPLTVQIEHGNTRHQPCSELTQCIGSSDAHITVGTACCHAQEHVAMFPINAHVEKGNAYRHEQHNVAQLKG